MNEYKLPHRTHIGYVHLKISNREKILRFYKELLGFQEMERSGERSSLSADGQTQYHIILTEDRSARPRQPFTTGLFHLAIRVPNRVQLARMFLRLYEHHYPFQGFADHGVSEALYLADPEGNGVEIYVDRPKDQWLYKQGHLQMTSDPLDLQGLVKELGEVKYAWTGIHPGTDIGHIHLQVSQLAHADKFYHRILGMDVTQDNYSGALFLSAGGYHHHIGANIWASKGGAAPSPDSLGLTGFGIHIPEKQNREILIRHLRENNVNMEQSDNRLFVEDHDHNTIELIFD